MASPRRRSRCTKRIAKLEGHAPFAAEALCRLRLKTGDFAGGLTALEEVRRGTPVDAQLELNLRMARTLFEDLSRPVEAAFALAPALRVHPAVADVRDLGRRLLGDAVALREVIGQFENAVAKADEREAFTVLEFLTAAREETAALPEARLRWLMRILELSAIDPERTLEIVATGAVENPESLALWEGFEILARRLERPRTLADAYRRALMESVTDPAVAERLGTRLVATETEFGLASPDTASALARMLMVVPEARWAFDRVKLAFGAQARWDELFELYDRVAAATAVDSERAMLLDEAALAARDLAARPDKAIPYLESLRAIRREDPSIEAALDRALRSRGAHTQTHRASRRTRRSRERFSFA